MLPWNDLVEKSIREMSKFPKKRWFTLLCCKVRYRFAIVNRMAYVVIMHVYQLKMLKTVRNVFNRYRVLESYKKTNSFKTAQRNRACFQNYL